jgi:hypothetical protein
MRLGELGDFERQLMVSVGVGKITRANAEAQLLKRAAYFQRAAEEEPPVVLAISKGPGTELKALLKKVGITASPGCACTKRAKIMDEKGCDWCAQNVDEIISWLRDEATKRNLPFFDVAGRLLVRRAIRNARRTDTIS